MLYERRHTRAMADFGGIAKSVPVLSFFMLFSVFASAGLPGLNGFVGEFMILVGSFKSDVVGNPILIAFATTGVIFAAVYLLWMVYRTFFGPVTDPENETMADLNPREIGLLMPLAVLMLVMGFWPAPFLARSEATVQGLLATVAAKGEAVEAAAETAVAGTTSAPVVVPIVWPESVAVTAPEETAPAAPADAN